MQSVNRLAGLDVPQMQKARRHGLRAFSKRWLLAVATNRFDRAAFHGFLALRFFVGRGRLFEDERISSVIIARVIGRGSFPAQVTINALIVHVVFSGHVFWILICDVSHKFLLLYVSLSDGFKC